MDLFTGLVIHEGSKTLVEVPISEEKKVRFRTLDFEIHHDGEFEALVSCFYIRISIMVAAVDFALRYEVK